MDLDNSSTVDGEDSNLDDLLSEESSFYGLRCLTIDQC